MYLLIWAFFLFCSTSVHISTFLEMYLVLIAFYLYVFANITFISLLVKVAEHSFGSLWLCVICQIMARDRLLLTSWNLASEKCTDERFWLTGKSWRFRSFHGNRTIEYNLKISLFLSLHKIRSLDFPINLHTAYYN